MEMTSNGVSNSRIQTYKSCRRLYELQYVYGVKAKPTETLERGLNYHDKIEKMLKGDGLVFDENIKTNAMAVAFQKYIAPALNASVCEDWFEFYPSGSKRAVFGRIDALNSDGKLIEHKTTSSEVNGEYWNSLENNEQILTYMLAYKTNTMLYTVCRTPTIRQKKGETDEEFQQRCIDWYDEDTEHKIAVQEIFRSDEQLAEFEDMLSKTINEMYSCELFYRNPNHCHKWGRMCEYASICGHYDPEQTYVGFEIKEEYGKQKESEVLDI